MTLEDAPHGSQREEILKPERKRIQNYRSMHPFAWFTEGSTKATFRNPGTLGEGWLERYGIDAAVHELNCQWIAGLKDYPSSRHWQRYGEELARVFYDYFESF